MFVFKTKKSLISVLFFVVVGQGLNLQAQQNKENLIKTLAGIDIKTNADVCKKHLQNKCGSEDYPRATKFADCVSKLSVNQNKSCVKFVKTFQIFRFIKNQVDFNCAESIKLCQTSDPKKSIKTCILSNKKVLTNKCEVSLSRLVVINEWLIANYNSGFGNYIK